MSQTAQEREDRVAQALLAYAPDSAEDVVSGLLKRLGITQVPDVARQRCPELSKSETECFGGSHHHVDPTAVAGTFHPDRAPLVTTRQCPIAWRAAARRRIPAEAERLKGLLAKCGYTRLGPTDQREIHRVLRAALDIGRPVENLPRAVRMVDHFRDKPLDRSIILEGERGLAKTHLQQIVHFSLLAQGVSSRFVQSHEIRSLAARRQSANEDTATDADNELRMLQRAEVLIWSDLDDSRDRVRNMADTTQDLLELFDGALMVSTNSDREALEKSDNVGPRAADRIFADRCGKAAVVIKLKGQSQRARP